MIKIIKKDIFILNLNIYLKNVMGGHWTVMQISFE